MTQLFANNAVGVLAQDVAPGATALTLSSGNGNRFPQPANGDYALATLIGVNANGQESQWEIVKITNRTGDVLTVERGQEDTEATEWQAGARLEQRLTKGTLENLQVLFPLAVNKGGTGQNAAGADGTVLSGDSQSPSGTSWKTPPMPAPFVADGDKSSISQGSVISKLQLTQFKIQPAATGSPASISSSLFTLSRDADGNLNMTVGGTTTLLFDASITYYDDFSAEGITYNFYDSPPTLVFDTPQTITAVSGDVDTLAFAVEIESKAGVIAAEDAASARGALGQKSVHRFQDVFGGLPNTYEFYTNSTGKDIELNCLFSVPAGLNSIETVSLYILDENANSIFLDFHDVVPDQNKAKRVMIQAMIPAGARFNFQFDTSDGVEPIDDQNTSAGGYWYQIVIF
jgi:hypothetical protein